MYKKTLIASLQQEQPELWRSIEGAAAEGLMIIDAANDALTATNRLLFTYPGLHEVLAFITDQWVEQDLAEQSALSDLLKPKNFNHL